MTHSLFIRNPTDDSIHEVWKFIKDPDGIISIWSNTWYGRHVIGQDCEFVSQEDQINLHSFLHLYGKPTNNITLLQDRPSQETRT